MINYIQNKKKKEKYFTINGVEVEIKDVVPDDVDIKKTIDKVFAILPQTLTSLIKFIKIGDFDELRDRDLDALYKDKTIYLTNIQDSNEDMLDDIVHEIAHSVEENYAELIYSDQKIKKEFIQKRLKLKNSLEKLGFYIEEKKYKNTSYDRDFDMFLYEKVGYDTLSSITSGMFLSPYAATSLREYFANGFENIFIKSDSYRILKNMSPRLFEKLIKIINLGENKYDF